MKAQIDEFALVLLAGLILIGILAVVWTTQAAQQLTVTPDSKYLTLARGSSSYFFLFLNGSASNVTLRASGEIASWISFDIQNFDVFGKEKVTVYVNVPSYASYGLHRGDIYVEALGYQKKISVVINVSTTTEEEMKIIEFGDFKVGYIIGEEVVKRKEGLIVEKSFFKEISPSFAVVIPEDKLPMIKEGYMRVIIEQTNGLGDLVIELNKQKIFEGRVGVGELILPIPKELMKKSNSVFLKTTSPLAFWSSSIYEISLIEFAVEYNGTIFKNFEFELSDMEVKNFKQGTISFFVKRASEMTGEKELIIKINDQKIYEGVPFQYLRKSFGAEANLQPGINKISFSTKEGASYLLENVKLTIKMY